MKQNEPLVLDVTAEEQTFFASAAEPAAVETVVDDELPPLTLRPEQLERRLWFRRQVGRLMAGLAAFSVVTTALRLASGL